MGEVIEARGTRLDRVVAIKVLPEKLARAAYEVWNFPQDVTAALFDGFRKAGLDIKG